MTTCYSGLYNLSWNHESMMNHHRLGNSMMENCNCNNNIINAVTDSSKILINGHKFQERQLDFMINVDQFFETKRRVDAIKNELLCYLNDVSCSIGVLCSCLMDLSDRLMRLSPEVSYYSDDDKETLIQLLFTAIKKANFSLYSSLNLGILLQDRDTDSLRMLLIHVISFRPLPFSFLQFKEIEAMISMIPTTSSPNMNRSYETGVVEAVSDYQKKSGRSRMYANGNGLPTPTCLQEADYTWDFDTIDEISSSMNLNPNVSLAVNAPQNTMKPYESDVIEAVSTYRQKFARGWMYTNGNELPSPTRSQEDDHTEEWDRIYGISSSINLLKRKTVAELVLDGPELKRQRNDSACESGKVCLKPRDPRRIHFETTAKVVSKTMPDEPEVNTPINPTNSSTTKPQDIISTNELFTNNLKNTADNLKSVNLFQKQTGLVCEQVNAGPVQQPKANALRDVEHYLDGFNEQQKADIWKERARRLEEQMKLFANRKLSLVLDLDHTLLNSVRFGDVDPRDAELLRKKEEQESGKPERHLFRLPHMSMWTKLRPGIWKFLEKASKMFELHISTMGNTRYATEMAKLLDPKGELFSGRVISHGDDSEEPSEDGDVPKTKDMEGILGMDSSVVIIDDTVRVWPHHKLNLINVERYIFSPSSGQQLGLSGRSLFEVNRDERREDGTLASALALIEKIHENFFANNSVDEADVRDILASVRRKVLAGCCILFSRIIPIGEANPDRHPLWQTAERFGAVCTSQIDDQVTHVVARSFGTDRVNWALSNGRFVVHPGWLEASAFLYRRANEQDFVIKGQK